jgi:PPOX class probable F420-dependent enzyme
MDSPLTAAALDADGLAQLARRLESPVVIYWIHEYGSYVWVVRPDGNIHAVGMWYGFLEGAIAVESKAKAQKVQNVLRDPRITCMIETGEYYEELQGVSVIGRAEVVDDPARMWELGVSVMERYYMPYNEDLRPAVEAMLNKRVVVKVDPIRVISWDHRKLGLPSTRPATT